MPAAERNAAIDGLRGVSIVPVVLFHTALRSHFRGGWIGVEVFFAVSGFLITTLLIGEADSQGRVSLRRFYARRWLRLSPPLFVMLALATLWGATQGQHWFLETAAAAAYTYNYANLLTGRYFSPFPQVWSLAVEEHFYLIWPAVLVVMLRRLTHRQVLSVTAALALTVLLWRTGLWVAGAPIDRLYLATDTRLDSLLVGCLAGAAFAFHLIGPIVQRASAAIIVIGGPLMLAALFGAPLESRWVFTAPLTAMAIVAASACVLVATTPTSALARVLSWRPLAALGRVSYSWYLIHYLIIRAMPIDDPRISVPVHVAASLAAALLLFAAVELPTERLRRRFRAASSTALAVSP